ncbi:BppU family phage baseplate upper protein [Limosilactobacillus reuteri]|uniref:BppU family phage baseplate upper protein n=1 Tax=Limosilactobacillus reuteri TaxID=1598 RepID=UPI0009BF859D|nr:BppU family phage baseplate upper protein [Limosilactobacillus reuteri]
MSQTLTYVIGQDRRPHVDNVQDFKVNFDGSNTNWVQARQYERSMRQVFVNIKNEDGTPLDLTGCNVWFEGLLPKNSAGDFRIIDDKGYVALDPTAGRFRFDMPGHAFTVAGSYRQAFFRILKDGNSITTLEFDLDVLADKVIDGLMPRTYISPFEDLYDQLVKILDNADGKLQDKLTEWNSKLQNLFDTLNKMGTDTQTLLQTLQNRIADLEEKIKQDGLFTQAEAEAFENTLTKKVTDLMDQYSKKFDQGLATITDKANYNYDYQLDSPDNILFPAFTKQGQNAYRDELYISDNGVDLYHVNRYGAGIDFTDHSPAVDCSTMFYEGYVYQIYDYVKSPYPDQINSHFLGGNGIQIRRSKDLINWEFIDVDLPTQWLQTWAPEWYVEDGNVYVVVSLSDCSASFKNETDGVVNWVKQTYIISTSDFKTWTEPQLINLGLDNCIDPFIIKENGNYYLFVKNEVTGKIIEFKSDSLMTGYKQVCILDTNSNAVFEGPAVVEYKGGYLLIVDAPNEGLVAFYSNDIEKWGQTVHLSVNDGQVVKHCTPITLKDNKLREIVKNYVKVKGGLSPFAVSNQNTKKLSYIYPGQTKVSLFPNALYVAQSNVTSEISITDYDTNLLRYGDMVEFALMSGNYGAKVSLAGNPNQQVWLPTTLELSAAKSNSNSIVTLECTNLGLVPQVYQPAPSFVYSRKTVDLKDAFAKTGGEYKPTADGYLMITVKTSGNQYLNILWADLGQSLYANTFQGSGYPAITVPVRSQNTYRVEYNVDQIMSAKFFYTEASIQV